MNARVALDNAKAQALREVEEAAGNGDAGRVLNVGRRLQEIESLIGRWTRLESDVDDLLIRDRQTGDLSREKQPLVNEVSMPERDGISSRAYGKTKRAEFLDRAKSAGVTLLHDHGVIYRNPSGRRIGIAFSKEHKPGRWFFGLKDDSFDHVLLLFETTDGESFAIFLNHDFLTAHGESLSRSTTGDVKFNVVRRASSFEIIGTGIEVDPLQKYNDLLD